MKARGRIKYYEAGTIILKCDIQDVSSLLDKDLDIELKAHKERRSLDANAYMWALIGQMAAILKTSKEDVYHRMLCDYGTLRLDPDGVAVWHILPTDESHDIHLMRTPNKVRLQTKKGSKEGFVYLEIKGSSEYNTQEMTTLIDGIVYEAKQLGIQTETENSIREMVERYGK